MPLASKTEDRSEVQLGGNFLGHLPLTRPLYETLKATHAPRVVTLSGITHRSANIDFGNLKLEKTYDPKRKYCQRRLADIVSALELGRGWILNWPHGVGQQQSTPRVLPFRERQPPFYKS